MDGQTRRAITVIGAGTVGHGIAEVAALAGYSVSLLIDSAGDVFGRIETETDTTTALESVDIVIEVVPENMELK